jgi:hypothetical protein
MSGPAPTSILVAAITCQFAGGDIGRTGDRTTEFFGTLIQRRAFFAGKMLVNQIAHDGRLGTAKRLRLLLQECDLFTFQFQGDSFHVAKVFLLWQKVNTRKTGYQNARWRLFELSERPQIAGFRRRRNY